MMLSDIYHIPTALSLAVIAVVLAVVASIVRARGLAARNAEPRAQACREVGEEITSKK